MTQLQYAIKKQITKEMRAVAKYENMEAELVRQRVEQGLIVIPANINHKNLAPIGIGLGLKTKINANIGASPVKSNLATELKKLKIAIDAGADSIMDLSIGDDIDAIRREIIKKCNVILGTVPLYQTAVEAKEIKNMNIDSYLEVLEKQARDGVDFVTVHAGVTKSIFPLIEKRLMKCVSRGGSFLLAWMRYHKKENFLYEHFDKILDIAIKYDMTISLGDGLRPGCIADATDVAQIHELKTLGKLAKIARAKGAQVIIEGPGHVPLNEVEENVRLAKKYCNNAPFYILGPLPTDIATGYDHIACAIGGALACSRGADFLCYVTPREHIGLPCVEDVREGVVVAKIAAHIADIAKGNKEAIARDYKMSKARYDIDWNEMEKYVIDPQKFKELRKEECNKNPDMKKNEKYCSMCGPFCAYKLND